MAQNFKTAEEVQEYLKNLYIEYKFGCYSEKTAEACHLLGEYEESIKKNMEKAIDLYKTNCDERNYGRSCAKYSNSALTGKGCKENIEEGYIYGKKGCEFGDQYACLQGGLVAMSDKVLFEKDRGIQISKGIEMLGKSCWDHNLEKACYLLSGVYISGIKDYLEPNLTEAYKLSIKSCDAGNPYACANISQMYSRGEGTEKNPSLADAFKKRALDLHQEISVTRRQLKFQQGV